MLFPAMVMDLVLLRSKFRLYLESSIRDDLMIGKTSAAEPINGYFLSQFADGVSFTVRCLSEVSSVCLALSYNGFSF
jgi:hypothetical protein